MDEQSPDDILHSLSIEGGEECSSASRGMPSSATSMTHSKTNVEEISWISKVRKNINLARHVDHPNGRCTIFKVPEHIRQLDPKAYTPVVASLGPFHHADPYSTSAIQSHKWRCVRHLLSCHQSQKCASQLLDKCLLDLKKQDDKVRSCYSEEFSALNAEDMALIMLLDGCFILYLMLRREKLFEKLKKKGLEEKMKEVDKDVVRNLEYETVEEDESKKRRECMIDIGEGDQVVLNIEEKDRHLEGPTMAGLSTLGLVVQDLLKLENQIPFFIIQLLFDNLKAPKDGDVDLVDLALHLFKCIHPNPKESKSFKKKSPSKYHHLLHLFYSSRIPLNGLPSPEEADPSQGASAFAPKWTPNATELQRAGVKFARKESADSSLSVTFEWRKMKIAPLLCLLKLASGRMQIPPLQIYDGTDSLFRNLIAFEQCYFNTKMYFTIYALFMHSIIAHAKDVRLLHLEGILEHGLSNDQAVVDLFNELGNQIYVICDMNYLANQIKKVNEFYGSKWRKWLAGLRRDYLDGPWAIISILAAIFLLLLTVEQATFSALSYFYNS